MITKVILLLAMWDAHMTCEASKILAILPIPSYSHQSSFRPLMLELAKREHEVTVITPIPTIYDMGKIQTNLTTIAVPVKLTEWNEKLTFCLKNKCDMQDHVISFLNSVTKMFEAQMMTDGVQKLIHDKSRKFDLIFYENAVSAAIGFSYLYKVPVIEISSLGSSTLDAVGAMSHSVLYPIPLRKRIYNLTLWDNISELYIQLSALYFYTTRFEPLESMMLKRIFGPDIPEVIELRKNIQMVFLNIPPIWDFNRPVPPSVVYLGGLTHALNGLEKLPEDLKSYLDSSINGVIYMSFGSSIDLSQLSNGTLKVLTNAMAKLPYDVLLKSSDDELLRLPRNVRIFKWLPQLDVLMHPKMKLFINHGGLQSTFESVEAGVPMVVIPLFTDGWFNAEQCEIHGVGIKLLIETITEAKLKIAIETVIGNKSYRENTVKLRSILRDQPQSSLERAVWWTEHVLRHGGAEHLRAAHAHAAWPEYYMLDVLLTLMAVVVTALVIVVLLIRLMLRKFITMTYKVKKS